MSDPLVLSACTLRPWHRDDRASLLIHANNWNVARWLSHEFPHPYGDAEADAWFDLLEWRDPAAAVTAAIEVDGNAVGGIGIKLGAGVFEGSGELGYWLGEAFWGRGIVSAAVTAFVPAVMARCGLRRVGAWAMVDNVRSIRVLEKCGFVHEGVQRASVVKDGRVCDRVMFGRMA